VLRIGIAGCGRAARIHRDRLVALAEVAVAGCVDSDRSCTESFASKIGQTAGPGRAPAGVFTDHRELLWRLGPDALSIFTPHFWHYPLARDTLQASRHVFIQKPISTNVQEAADIVGLARGRSLKVAVEHQYRLCPSLAEARRHLQEAARDRQNATKRESFQGGNTRMPTNPESESLAELRERSRGNLQSRERPRRRPAATRKSRYLTMMRHVD
jgi:predicted dehydrogenase